MFWSEIYLVTALIVNAWTGENYGFLSGKPDNPSLLDLLSDVHWIYVVQINLLAVVFFSALYLPWFVWDRWRGKGAVGQTSNVQRPTSNVQSAE